MKKIVHIFSEGEGPTLISKLTSDLIVVLYYHQVHEHFLKDFSHKIMPSWANKISWEPESEESLI